MSADLDRLLTDAARDPEAGPDVADLVTRGRRRSTVRRVAAGAGTAALVAVAVAVLPGLIPADAPEIADSPDAVPTADPSPDTSGPSVVALPEIALADLPSDLGLLVRSADGAGGLRLVDVGADGLVRDVAGLAAGALPDADRLVVATRDGGVAFGSTCTDSDGAERACVVSFSPDDPQPVVTFGVSDVVGLDPDGNPLVRLDRDVVDVAAGDVLRVLRDGRVERVTQPLGDLGPGAFGDAGIDPGAVLRSASVDPGTGRVAMLWSDGGVAVVSGGDDSVSVTGIAADGQPGAALFWRDGRVVVVGDDDGEGRDGLLVESFDPAEPGVVASTGTPLPDGEVSQVAYDADADLLAVSLRDPATGEDLPPVVVDLVDGPDGFSVVGPRRLAPVSVEGLGDGLAGRLLLTAEQPLLGCADHPGLFSEPTGTTGVWFVCFDAGDERGDGYVRFDAEAGVWPSATDAPVDVDALQALVDAWAAGPGDGPVVTGLTGGLDPEIATLDVVSLDDGVITLDVVSGPVAGVLSTSTGGVTFDLQVVSLLTQFDAVDAVAFTLDGDCSAWWEFRQVGETCLPPVSRAAWDR